MAETQHYEPYTKKHPPRFILVQLHQYNVISCRNKYIDITFPMYAHAIRLMFFLLAVKVKYLKEYNQLYPFQIKGQESIHTMQNFAFSACTLIHLTTRYCLYTLRYLFDI